MTPLYDPMPRTDEELPPPVGFITRKQHEAILRQVRAGDATLLAAEVRAIIAAAERFRRAVGNWTVANSYGTEEEDALAWGEVMAADDALSAALDAMPRAALAAMKGEV